MTPLKLQHTLVTYREQHHLTQAALADQLYVSRQTISNWETGKTYPDIKSLLLLASLYHVTINELVQEDLTTMHQRTSNFHLKPLISVAIACLIAVYGLFIGLRWLPMIPTIMAISTVTTIGLASTGYLLYLSQRLQLKTFRQINAYLHHQSAPITKPERKYRTVTLVLSALIGLAIGGGLTWWIATAFLHWSL
ncbi:MULTISPECIES: helix-turn-helix transcriptional regulator [unclassified Levilactobacillus]|uniref:helix-turn-helix transcriptional regulator n=1 Tax=unclassified Levilactobacillus TaxID=2767918 RepID=UPI002FF3E3C0